MEQLLVLLGSVLFVSLCRGQNLCKEDKCPNFRLVEKTQDYEVRDYQTTDWISTKIEKDDAWAAHLKLKDYKQQQKKKDPDAEFADDTWPVLITERPDGKYMSWFLTPDTQKPENNSPDVRLERRPAGTVYVRIFYESMNLDTLVENKEQLQKDLNKVGKHFDHTSSCGAMFYPLMSLTRHNEIWIWASNQA